MVCLCKKLALACAVMLMLTGCNNRNAVVEETTVVVTEFIETEPAMPLKNEQTDVLSASSQSPEWTESDLQAIVRTLTGECYDDKEDDKRRVCEVILNRVSAGGFGDTILEVVTAENQFDGYWNPLREASENDLVVAEQTLKDWYENECKMLSEYLFFNAGDNRENEFRSKF